MLRVGSSATDATLTKLRDISFPRFVLSQNQQTAYMDYLERRKILGVAPR